MTLFTKPEEVRAEENMAYVQLEEEFFQVSHSASGLERNGRA